MSVSVMTLSNDIISKKLPDENLIKEWIRFCDVKFETQKTYFKAVKQFCFYLSDRGITNPNRNDVMEFRDLLLKTYRPTTTRLYLTAVKMFVRWLASKGICSNFADNVKSIKFIPTHNRDALTPAESIQVIESFIGDDIKTIRDKSIMALMLSCGLRSIEVVRLDCGDIEKRQGKIFISVHGKARDGKTDKVQLPLEIYKLIRNYLKLRGKIKPSEPLFVSLSNQNKNHRLETQTISRLAKNVFKKIGIDSPRITCHSCRHTAATNMLLAGVDIAKVQQILRHKNPATTQIYRHDLDEMNNEGTSIAADILVGNFNSSPKSPLIKV